MHTILTRTQALAGGFKFFYTGRPCVQGHDARRYTSTGNCVDCHRQRGRSTATLAQRGRVARQQGLFSYLLHPDDHASALAFCQALDMQRGVVPKSPPELQPSHAPRTREEMLHLQSLALGRVIPAPAPQALPPMDN